MLNIQHTKQGFYFSLLNSKNEIILEGQYSKLSGLWIWRNNQYTKTNGVFTKC